MYKGKVVISLAIITIILTLSIVYAAVINKGFQIGGLLSSDVDPSLFIVRFTGVPTVNLGNTSASVTALIDENDNKKAILNVDELKTAGQTVSATFTVVNDSASLKASLGTPVISNNNSEYYEVSSSYNTNNPLLASGQTAELTITVRLLKTPIDKNANIESDTIITLVATPVQS
jgi:hypothetical protein